MSDLDPFGGLNIGLLSLITMTFYLFFLFFFFFFFFFFFLWISENSFFLKRKCLTCTTMTGIGCPNSWQSIDLAGLAMGTVHFSVILFPITS